MSTRLIHAVGLHPEAPRVVLAPRHAVVLARQRVLRALLPQIRTRRLAVERVAICAPLELLVHGRRLLGVDALLNPVWYLDAASLRIVDDDGGEERIAARVSRRRREGGRHGWRWQRLCGGQPWSGPSCTSA